jgi:hypothetical protein
MENAFVTQCACVLFDRAPALEQVQAALDEWPIDAAVPPASGEDGWAFGGPGFIIARPGRAFMHVDVVDRPWPDDARGLAAAWRSGAFGPATAPGALSRAMEQCWDWPGPAAAQRHRAFVRIRCGVPMPGGVAPELPRDHDPAFELSALTELAAALLRLPGASALFFPGGEALRSREQVEAVQRRKAGVGGPPVDLWSNVRAVRLGQHGDAAWLLLDVVGMAQLRLPDVEAVFPEGAGPPEAVEALLRNACRHLAAGKPIAAGSTADDGQGRRWTASLESGLLAPRRPVVRWLSEDGPRPPEALLASVAGT